MNIATVSEDSSHFNSLPALNRRRSLFPCEHIDSESDSDLGHISPLNFDSSFDQENINIKVLGPKQSKKADKTIGDYDIIEVVEDQNLVGCTPQRKYSQMEVMSPLYLSPHFNKMETTIEDTPSKMSPFFKLKTPHDAPNTNSKLPKLLRKSLLDSEITSDSSKRKLSPDSSPRKIKQIKQDPKFSRVRTTLFPEVDFALSTKSFYPRYEDNLKKIMNKKDILPKSSILFSTNRKTKTRKKIGQINSGVGHKIRKPKPKKFIKTSLVKATLNAIKSTAITDYIMDLKELNSRSELPKLIKNREDSQPTDKLISAPIVSEQQKLITPAVIPEKKIVDMESKKRSHSPELEPDPNKKFFKYSRAKGVVVVNNNIKLKVDHNKMTLLENNKVNNEVSFDMSDFNNDDLDGSQTNIDSILSCLQDEEHNIPEENKIILQATNSVVTSDNSILLHQNAGTPNKVNTISEENKIILQATNSVVASDNSILLHKHACTANLILSPISQMCDVTSGLALNTPKKVRNLTPILEDLTEEGSLTDIQKNEKLFPVFYPGHAGTPNKNDKVLTNVEKKFKRLSEDQMLIDAGQKKFGVTQCHECNFVYHEGDPCDEIMHLNYHSNRHILRFTGWKNERIVADFPTNGRIIQILPGDSKLWWKKVKDLIGAISNELGCYEMDNLDDCQVYLYIKKKTIVGCLIASPKSEGYQMLSPIGNNVNLCLQQSHPVKCGISLIWVSANNRRTGIATQMMNALKRNFIKTTFLCNAEIALSTPTEMGKEFAQKYFKTKNYFVYFV